MVQVAQRIAGKISIEIRSIGRARWHYKSLAGQSQSSVGQSVATNLAYCCKIIPSHIYDPDGRQRVCECNIIQSTDFSKTIDFNLASSLSISILKRGSMFILSENQFEDLLLAGGFLPSNFPNETMIDILDIGAGDGEVTSRLAKAVIHMGNDVLLKVYATEYSWTMRDRLQKKQFTYVWRWNVVLCKMVICVNRLQYLQGDWQIE